MRNRAIIWLGMLSLAALPLLPACTVHTDVRPAGVAVVDPGWYYDSEYYDDTHQWHPREYYYYDGHRWDHRDRAPEGIVARERAHADYHRR